jgi:uncharacterized protein YggL (DUF469 family)
MQPKMKKLFTERHGMKGPRVREELCLLLRHTASDCGRRKSESRRVWVEHPEIREVDVNPLLVTTQSALALDALVVLDSWGFFIN